MTDTSSVVDGTTGAAAEGGEKTAAAVPLTPAQQIEKQVADQAFAHLLNTRQALRYTIAEIKTRPDNLAQLEAQLAHVEGLIAESGRQDPELVNIDQQAATAEANAQRAAQSAKALAEDAARVRDLANKAKEKGGAKTPAAA